MDEILRLLGSNPIFSSLDEIKLAEFARLASLKNYQKGEFLSLLGDHWPYLFVPVRGIIDAKKDSSEGRSLLIASFGAGEIFWGLSFFIDGTPMPVSLEVRENSRVYLWSRIKCQPFLIQNGELLWEITCTMAQRMMRASEMLEGLAFRPVAQRLARLLLDQYPVEQQSKERSLTLDEMAARIGSTREMVCRALYRFAAQGAIEINRTEFAFKNRQLLEDYK